MAQIYISVGSNIDAARNIRGGVAAMRERFGELAVSPVYESTAVGFDGDDFLNLVVGASTHEDIESVVQHLRDIEDRFGRDRRGPRFSSRSLDLDLLLYDERIFRDKGIDIPREEITRNAFVLLPLRDLAPALVHPELKRSIEELWSGFDQSSQQLHVIDFDWSSD